MFTSSKVIAVFSMVSTALIGCTQNVDLIRPGATAGMLELVNASSHTLLEVTITQCTTTTPGLSRLDAGEVIIPSATRRWAVSEGCYYVLTGYDGPAGAGFSESQIQIEAERVYTLTVRQ